MAQKVTLRDYQQSILDKLDMIRADASSASINYLGVEISGRNVLVNLVDITETLVVPEVEPVPLVKPWFLGMTNVRGVLYAVNDLGQLLDNRLTEISSNTRMLLINDSIVSNVSVLVDRLIGLRNLDDLSTQDGEADNGVCFKPVSYVDDESKVWNVLDCERLASSREFEVPYAI